MGGCCTKNKGHICKKKNLLNHGHLQALHTIKCKNIITEKNLY